MSSPDLLSGLVQIHIFQMEFFQSGPVQIKKFQLYIVFNLDQSRFEIFNSEFSIWSSPDLKFTIEFF